MKKLLPGIALTLLIAIVAKFAANYFSALGSVTLAILLGLVVGNVFPAKETFKSGINFSEKTILTWAIMLMGFKLQFQNVAALGWFPFAVILPVMAVTILSALVIGRLLGYSTEFTTMMGVGNAVCGSSAIAAVAPSLKAKEEDFGIAVSIVNLMGAGGIFLLPFLAHLFHYDNTHSSYLVGGILQAIGHVVAGGFSINESVGETATLIKMLRVLMIGPVAVIVSMIFCANKGSASKKNYIPAYIIGFVICSLLATIFSSDQMVIPHLKHLAKFLLMIAMAGVGMKIRFATLLKQGPKALLFGLMIFAIQIVFMVLLLHYIC